MDCSSDLPSDTIFEILSRTTSLETLDTCKTVCQVWNRLVYESSFMSKYYKNTNNIYGYYIQYLKPCGHDQEFISLGQTQLDKEHMSIKVDEDKFKDKYVKIEASSKQGILCVIARKSLHYRYYVCKPSTKQWQSLPNPKLRFSTEKVVLVVLRGKPLRYKIVRLSRDGRPNSEMSWYSYCCEIFDSKLWKWNRVKDVVLPDDVIFDDMSQSVQTSGLIYWLTSDHHVVVFNLEDETHSRFSLPTSHGDCRCLLTEYEGRLGCLNSTADGYAELWLVDNSKSHNWKLTKRIEIETSLVGGYAMTLGLYNRDIALAYTYFKMTFYKLQDHCIEKSISLRHNFEHIFPFRSDLEPVNLRGE